MILPGVGAFGDAKAKLDATAVDSTPLDLRQGAVLGQRLDDPWLRASQGYDHNLVLSAARYGRRSHTAWRAVRWSSTTRLSLTETRW